MDKRKILLQFIDHTIEDDMRIYQIKHTPIVFKKSLTGHALKEFGHLPVERNKVIFDNYKGAGFGCNPKYVTLALLEKKKDLDIVWMVKNKSQHTDEFPKGVRLVEYHTKEALKEYFTAGVWVDNFHLASYYNIGLVKRTGQTFIQLWHGSLGIKKIEKNKKKNKGERETSKFFTIEHKDINLKEQILLKNSVGKSNEKMYLNCQK